MDTLILVVDDDAGFLRVVTQMLTREGLTVVATAETAAAGLAAAREHRPDAALVDVGLPDRDGIDLGHELAAMPWTPRVVLTSSDRDAAGLAARGNGLPFVPKEDLPTAPLRELLTG